MTDRSRVTGGGAVAAVLAAAGVHCVFGLLGGSMLELFDALSASPGLRYVGARDERAAGHMADAYARITGGPGVVLGAQAGPGVVNLVTAVAEAHLAYSPLVVIAGAISRRDLGKDTFQEIDQVALFQPIAKRSLLVSDPDRLVEMLQDALRLAMSGRRGPVVLHVPRDLFAAEVAAPRVRALEVAQAGPPSASFLAALTDLLAAARAPLLVAGGGIKWSRGGEALRALAEALGVPVVASTGHADVMPHDHPLFAGQGGPRGNALAGRLLRETDLLIALGTRLAFNSTFLDPAAVAPSGRIVQIDVEASAVGRYFPVALGAQAGAKASAQAILAAAQARGLSGARWTDWRDAFQRDRAALLAERAAEAANPAVPLHPRRALGEIREALPRDAIVTLDTGNACLQAADRLAHYQAPGLVTPLDFGLVGFGYAAALGAQAAAPERPVVAVLGDGGFGFTQAEISTAVQHDLPVVAVVLDNGAWGAEKAYQREYFGGRYLGADIASPRFDELARLCGAAGYRVDLPGELGPALRQALAARRPAVLHVKIDPTVLGALRKDLFSAPARG